MNKTFSLSRSFKFLAMAIVGIGALSIGISEHLTNEVKQIDAQATQLQAQANHAHELQFHVVQIQQFLTDVSATGDRGGFAEAAEHFQASNVLLDQMSKALPQYSDALNEVRSKLNTFNETGKRMAETYIANGQAAGNAMMKMPETGFDDSSLALVAALDKVVLPIEQQNEVLNVTGGNKTAQLGWLIALINGAAWSLLLLVLFGLGRQLMKALGGEPAAAVEIANEIAEGNIQSPIKLKANDKRSLMFAMSVMQKELQTFMFEQNAMSAENRKGNIEAAIESGKFRGSYKAMADNVNEMASNQAEVMRKVTHCVTEFSKGNFDAPLERLPGKLAFINDGVEQLRGNLKSLIAELYKMSEEHQNGNISFMMKPESFAGNYRLVAEGVNAMVAEYIDENKTVMACVEQFGNGNFSAKIKEYPGEKAFINKAIKKIGGNLKGLIESVNWVSSEHDKGEIDMKLRDDMFNGDFSILAKDVNKMMTGLLEMNEKSMSVVKAFGEGDFNAPLEKFPGKKASINQTIEQVRSNLKALNEDVQMLAHAAHEGKISVRADASQHQGDFRKIVEGVNETLEMIVGPIGTVKSAVETIN
ncbi:MAG: methyl-accepting chemotaxis protein, partial [Methylophilaceae bacterium]